MFRIYFGAFNDFVLFSVVEITERAEDGVDGGHGGIVARVDQSV